LISKTREGARVRKKYDDPKTPLERLLAANILREEHSAQLQDHHRSLDPIALLQDIRETQRQIADMLDRDTPRANEMAQDTKTFLGALRTAWKHAEVRPTHEVRPRPPRHWRTRKDPLADVWPQVELWLEREPELSATVVLARLIEGEVTAGIDSTLLRTLQRRVKQWRAAQVDRLLHMP